MAASCFLFCLSSLAGLTDRDRQPRASTRRTCCLGAFTGPRRRRLIALRRVSVSAPRVQTPVGFIAGQQQRSEPVDLLRPHRGELPAGAQQDPQPSTVAIARGAWVVGLRPDAAPGSAARWASIGSDFPRRRSGRRGRSTSTTTRPAAARLGQDRCRSCGFPRGRPPPANLVCVRRSRPALQRSLLRRYRLSMRRDRRAGGAVISRAWVSRWVSPPMTASTTSASSGTGIGVSFRERTGQTGLGWKSPERHICDESRALDADRLLIKPARWDQDGVGAPGRRVLRRARRQAAKSRVSQSRAPTPILAAIRPEPP